MMTMLSGTIPLLGSIFYEPLLSPQPDLVSLGENLEPQWVEQQRQFYVILFLEASIEMPIRVIIFVSRCLVAMLPEAAPMKLVWPYLLI
jgi:hypothetical protein